MYVSITSGAACTTYPSHAWQLSQPNVIGNEYECHNLGTSSDYQLHAINAMFLVVPITGGPHGGVPLYSVASSLSNLDVFPSILPRRMLLRPSVYLPCSIFVLAVSNRMPQSDRSPRTTCPRPCPPPPRAMIQTDRLVVFCLLDTTLKYF